MKVCPVCHNKSASSVLVCTECGWEFRVYLTLSEEGQHEYQLELEQHRRNRNKSVPGEIWIEPRTGLEFVRLEGGNFQRRQWKNRLQRVWGPLHQVTISGFWLGKYPVTRDQWADIMQKSAPGTGEPDCPITHIAWIEVQIFIEKLTALTACPNFRLPTEAEWEYACRAGNSGCFCFGDNQRELKEYAWFKENSWQVKSVGKKRPNVWGLYDMHGNVQEWCQDWYGQYPAASVINPQGPVTGSCRVYRGGSYLHEAELCACDFRNWEKPGVRHPAIGFRLALSSIR